MRQPHEGPTAPGSRPGARVGRVARTLAWPVLALGLVVLALWLSFNETRGSEVVLVLTWLVLALGLAFNSWNRRKRHRRYLERFPTLDHLRRHVDEDALRKIRDEEGQVNAVRALRTQLPGVPLADAVQLVKTL